MNFGVKTADSGSTDQKLGEFAPELKYISKIVPPRDPADEKATEKQINYLNLLGVRDAGVLAALGKNQAAVLIDKIKNLRGAD